MEIPEGDPVEDLTSDPVDVDNEIVQDGNETEDKRIIESNKINNYQDELNLENNQNQLKIREIISERIPEFELTSNFKDFLPRVVTSANGAVGRHYNITLMELRTLFEHNQWVEDSIIDFYASFCLLNSDKNMYIISAQYKKCVSENLCHKQSKLTLYWNQRYLNSIKIDDLGLDTADWNDDVFEKLKIIYSDPLTIADEILFPIHQSGNHWVLIRIIKREKRGYLFDTAISSEKRKHKKACAPIFESLVYFLFKERGWRFDYQKIAVGFGHQPDSSSCGLYVLAFIEQLAFEKSNKIQAPKNTYTIKD